MSFKRALLTTILVSAPMLASAQPVSGLYIAGGAGVNWINNPSKWDLSGSTVPGNFGLPQNVTVNNAG